MLDRSSGKIGNFGEIGVFVSRDHPAVGEVKPLSTAAYVVADLPIDNHKAYFEKWNPLGYELMAHIRQSLERKGHLFEGNENNFSPVEKCDMGQEVRFIGIVGADTTEDEAGIKNLEPDHKKLLPKLVSDVRQALTDFQTLKSGRIKKSDPGSQDMGV